MNHEVTPSQKVRKDLDFTVSAAAPKGYLEAIYAGILIWVSTFEVLTRHKPENPLGISNLLIF
jgi:hypothetical protein